MKKNISYYYTSIFICFLFLLMGHFNIKSESGFMIGCIQYPPITKVPLTRIYTFGKKIAFQLCEIVNESYQFIFRIPQIMHTKIYYLLITTRIHKKMISNNTVDYLKILPDQSYIFYKLTLIEHVDEGGNKTYTWLIEPESLDKVTGRIPDEAIIVCCDPCHVAGLSGGSAFELPTINLKSDLIRLLGSEELLQTDANRLLLSSIDSDTVHATINQKIRQKSHVTLIAPLV